MDIAKVYHFLLEIFQRENIDFSIIGGAALPSAKVARSTQDIDFLILAKDADKIKKAMAGVGYSLAHASEDVLNFIGSFAGAGRVDFLLAHRKYTLAMLARAKPFPIFGGQFMPKVLLPEDLIGLKIQASSNDHRRLHKDMADIIAVLKNNLHSMNMRLVREYFRLFGREAELNQILKEQRHAKPRRKAGDAGGRAQSKTR